MGIGRKKLRGNYCCFEWLGVHIGVKGRAGYACESAVSLANVITRRFLFRSQHSPLEIERTPPPETRRQQSPFKIFSNAEAAVVYACGYVAEITTLGEQGEEAGFGVGVGG